MGSIKILHVIVSFPLVNFAKFLYTGRGGCEYQKQVQVQLTKLFVFTKHTFFQQLITTNSVEALFTRTVSKQFSWQKFVRRGRYIERRFLKR